jgi:hypothetical protein
MEALMKITWNKMLRIFLVYSAVGWLVCLAGIFISANFAAEIMHWFGGVATEGIMNVPIYDYWFRMASSVFGMIGLFYLLLAWNPAKFAAVIPYAGWFMIIEGAILLVHGLILGLPPTPWLGDVGFCIVGGAGILVCLRKSNLQNTGS